MVYFEKKLGFSEVRYARPDVLGQITLGPMWFSG